MNVLYEINGSLVTLELSHQYVAPSTHKGHEGGELAEKLASWAK